MTPETLLSAALTVPGIERAVVLRATRLTCMIDVQFSGSCSVDDVGLAMLPVIGSGQLLRVTREGGAESAIFDPITEQRAADDVVHVHNQIFGISE